MYLVDGFQTLISFSFSGVLFIRAREVKPPELDLGGEIDTTVMNNTKFRTSAPKSLIKVGAISAQCQWDPFVYQQLLLQLGIRQTITVRFPDSSTIAFSGFVNKFTPASMKEGDFPLAELEMMVTSRNVAGLEIRPVSTVGVAIAAGVNGAAAAGNGPTQLGGAAIQNFREGQVIF